MRSLFSIYSACHLFFDKILCMKQNRDTLSEDKTPKMNILFSEQKSITEQVPLEIALN